jgi:hypothetical protein
VEIYRAPGFKLAVTFGKKDELASSLLPDIRFPIRDIFAQPPMPRKVKRKKRE